TLGRTTEFTTSMHPLTLSSGDVVRVHLIPGAGLPIVFLHGLGCASSCDYPTVVSASPLQGRSVVLIDLLGFGFSDKPPNFEYSVDSHASVVCEVMAGLNLQQVDLYGHSMGGSIAIVVATLQQKRIRSLVLSEPNLVPGGGQFSRSIAAQPELEYVESGHARCVQDARHAGHHIWAGSMRVASPLAVHRGAASLVMGSNPSWRSQLVALRCKRTVLFGEASLPDEDYSALPNEGVQVASVPSAGHSMAWENPTGLAAAISNSLLGPSAA
ncbi:partial Haloalkane dehalogenase 2, partial [Planctomycetaceae bacterium]